MLKRKLWIGAAALAVLPAWGPEARGQDVSVGPVQDVIIRRLNVHRGGPHRDRSVRDPGLDQLSESQRAEVRTAVGRWRRERIRLAADLRIAGMDLRDVRADAESSDADIRNLSDRVAELRKQSAQRRTDLQLEIRRIVGPEEWTKMRDRRSGRANGRYERWRGGSGSRGRSPIDQRRPGRRGDAGLGFPDPFTSEFRNSLGRFRRDAQQWGDRARRWLGEVQEGVAERRFRGFRDRDR